MDTQKIQTLLVDLFRLGLFPLQSVQIDDSKSGEVLLNFVTDSDTMLFIGHRGETFWSLQHLVKIILRAQGLLPDDVHLKVDVDSYRSKQESNVLQRADQAAQRVMETGQPVFLPPMSAYFRRLCHMHVSQKYPQLQTSSHGESNSRAVKIVPGAGHAVASPDAGYDVYDDIEL